MALRVHRSWAAYAATMLIAVLIAVQLVVVVFALHSIVIGLYGFRNQVPASPGSRRFRFVVGIPAHNEEAVILDLLEDLRNQTYPKSQYSVWVLDDRSSDRTAEIAERYANVLRRDEGSGGKGGVLRWFNEQRPLVHDEALVVLDADNRVQLDLLERFSDELDAGELSLQAYLDTSNPDDSWYTRASALHYWSSNRLERLSRSNLGWSSELGGTGMCIAAEAIEQVGTFRDVDSDDLDLDTRLVLAGIGTKWLHNVKVFDEKPVAMGVGIRQRARWARGVRTNRRGYFGSLSRRFIDDPSGEKLDAMIRHIRPPRIFVLATLGAIVVADILTSGPWLPWQASALTMIVLAGMPLAALVREGVPARRLAWFPIVAIYALLLIPIKVLSYFQRAWFHTPHVGSRGQREKS